jgi:molybdate transport system permease protein
MTPFAEFLSDPGIRGPLILTLRVCVVTVPLFLTAGIGLGYYLGRSRSLVASCVDFVVSAPMVFPPIATGFGLLLLFGKKSLLGRALHDLFGVELVFGFWGLAVAAFVSGLPLMVKPVQAAVGGEVARFMEVSRVLGKNRNGDFFRVVLPWCARTSWPGFFWPGPGPSARWGSRSCSGETSWAGPTPFSLEIYNSCSPATTSGRPCWPCFCRGLPGGHVFVLRHLSSD